MCGYRQCVKLAAEAADNGLISGELAAGIARVRGAPGELVGSRPGGTPDSGIQRCHSRGQARSGAVSRPDRLRVTSFRGRPTHLTHIQQRQQRSVIVDLLGKHGRVRSVPMPEWAKVAIDRGAVQPAFTPVRVFRPINRGGRLTHVSLSDKSLCMFCENTHLHLDLRTSLRTICGVVPTTRSCGLLARRPCRRHPRRARIRHNQRPPGMPTVGRRAVAYDWRLLSKAFHQKLVNAGR
jgi:hypothetical protein